MMNKVLKMQLSMYWKNLSSVIIHKGFWIRLKPKKMRLQCVDVFLKWANHFTVVGNVEWIRLVCYV